MLPPDGVLLMRVRPAWWTSSCSRFHSGRVGGGVRRGARD